MLSDLRFVFRSLARSRVFSAVTILTLALGIGSAASIFSVADWVLFRPTKFPDDVYLVGGQSEQTPFMPVRFEFMTRAYEQEKRAVTAFAKAASREGNIVIEGQPVATTWTGVSANLLPMLGLVPRLGRGFLPGEDLEGSDRVVIIADWFWKRHLGGRDDVLGRKMVVGDSVCTVVGILAPEQNLPLYFSGGVLRPLTYRVNPAVPWEPQFFLFAKLAPGVTAEQAQAALRGAKVEVPEIIRQYYGSDRLVLSSMADLNKIVRPEIYWVMVGAVGFLYAIACLNAANLLLVRLLGQQRELSIRLALGGGRIRIVRLLASECLLIAVLGGLAGLLVANWLFPLLLSATGNPGSGTRNWASWTLGWRSVGVLCLLTVLTSAMLAIVPAWRVLRGDIYTSLKEGGTTLGESRVLARLRGSFVVLQSAFAVILLAGAGLMIRTFVNFQHIDLGFAPEALAKAYVAFPPDYSTEPEPRLARLRELQAELQRVPGVKSVGFGTDVLLPGYYFASHTLDAGNGRPVKAAMGNFSSGFQETARLRLKAGRWIDQSRGGEVLINESLARSLWPKESGVGRTIRPIPNTAGWEPNHPGWIVAGVVGDVRSTMRDAPGNFLFGPENWTPANFNVFVVRLSRDLDVAFADALRRKVYAFDPRIVVHEVVSVTDFRDRQLWAERMANSILRVLAGISLFLSVTGVFAVLAYTVDRRKGEFGVRMAFGATPQDLVRLVLLRGVLLTFLGVAAGLVGTFFLTKFVASLLFGTTPTDPVVLAAVGAALVGTSVLACIWPARRAAKIDVTYLLRSE